MASLCACRDGPPPPAPAPAKAAAPPSTRAEAASAAPRPVDAPTDLIDASMVALADEHLLFWTPAWARLRGPDGSWFAIELPPRTHLVESSGANLLAVATDQDEQGTVFSLATSFDTRGHERGRWRVAEQALNLAFRGALPLLLTSRGMVALSPDGTASTPAPYGPNTPLPIGGAGRPYWFERDGAVTSCLGNLPTKGYPFASQCERTGEQGYHFALPFLEAHGCGAVLVVVTGEKANEVATFDLATGRPGPRRRFAQRPTLACIDDELVVGTAHAIERVRLPALDAIARVELPAGASLRDLAVSRTRIAYRLTATPNDVAFIAR